MAYFSQSAAKEGGNQGFEPVVGRRRTIVIGTSVIIVVNVRR